MHWASSSPHLPDDQDFDILEFYAGKANTTFSMRRKGFKSARFDLKYGRAEPERTNYMDLLDPSGFLFPGGY